MYIIENLTNADAAREIEVIINGFEKAGVPFIQNQDWPNYIVVNSFSIIPRTVIKCKP